jgi:hypothetical protein
LRPASAPNTRPAVRLWRTAWLKAHRQFMHWNNKVDIHVRLMCGRGLTIAMANEPAGQVGMIRHVQGTKKLGHFPAF